MPFLALIPPGVFLFPAESSFEVGAGRPFSSELPEAMLDADPPISFLPATGDFLLSGFRILGNVKCHHGGHELTNKFLRKLLNIKTAFEHVEVKDVVISEKIKSIQSTKIAVNA